MTIFNFASMRQVGTPEFSVFGAEFDVDAANFVTNLPDLDFYSWVTQIDPALGKAFPANAFPTPVGDIDLGNLGYTAYAQFTSTIRAVRLVLSQLATTVGFLKQSVSALGEVFKGTVAAVGDALNIALQVLDNPGFNAAINGLCAIPIVGWIIKAVVAGDNELLGGAGPGDLEWHRVEDHGLPGLRAARRSSVFKILRVSTEQHVLVHERRAGDWEAIAVGTAASAASCRRPPTRSADTRRG